MSMSTHVKKVLNFTMAAPGVHGTNRINGRLLGLLDYGTVVAFADVEVTHRAVINYIPDMPRLASDYMYGKFQYADGSIEYLGEPWIDESTYSVVGVQDILIRIPNGDPDKLRDARIALRSNGFEKFTINFADAPP